MLDGNSEHVCARVKATRIDVDLENAFGLISFRPHVICQKVLRVEHCFNTLKKAHCLSLRTITTTVLYYQYFLIHVNKMSNYRVNPTSAHLFTSYHRI